MSEGIGARVLRKEDKRFITGKGKYTDDVRNDNQCYAAFVRSPHAHAKVKGIDKSAAEAMDGVEAVLPVLGQRGLDPLPRVGVDEELEVASGGVDLE